MSQPRKRHNRLTSDMGPFSLLPEWVRTAEISDKAKLLYAYLNRMANLPKGAFPSMRWLAAENKSSESSIKRQLRELVKIGALTKEPRTRDNGSQTSNQYTVHLVQQDPQESWTPGEWADFLS